jgi:hypothetical protein
MASDIEITDVRLTPLPAEEMTPTMKQSSASWFTLTVTVKNVSGTEVYVVTAVQRIHYEASRRTLFMQFSGHELPEQSPIIDLPRPLPVRMIDPGEELAITTRVSSPVTFMQVTAEGLKPSFVRIPEDVETIVCTVAYDKTPPPREINLASLDPLPDTRRWGTPVARSFKPPRSGSDRAV